jgi:putative ABC transport system permease protein
MKFARLVLSNLKRKKIRTFLTLASILVAFVLFGYLTAIRQALTAGIDVAGADRLIVRHIVSIIQLLPGSYEADIEQIAGVAEATPATWFGGIYRESRNFFPQIIVKPEEYLSLYPDFELSKEQREAWFRTRTGAIVGRTTAERFEWKVGDKIPIQATYWSHGGGQKIWEFDLVGIYDGARKGVDTTQFFFRYDYFDEARDALRGTVGWYIVKVSDPDRAGEVVKAIDEKFANSPAETKAEPEEAFVRAFSDQIGNIGAIMQAILSAVFFTILLVAGNTMAQSVRERTGELAVLKAVGFTNGQVLGLVLAEALTFAVLGGFVGLAISWLAISIGGDPTGGRLPMFFFPTRDVIVGAVFVVVLGIATGLLPALQAGRLRIAHALRRLA